MSAGRPSRKRAPKSAPPAPPPADAGAGAGPARGGNDSPLQREHDELLARHAALAALHGGLEQSFGGKLHLAVEALRSTSAAVAVVQHGELALVNPAWSRLADGAGPSAWRRRGEAGGYLPLREVTLSEAAALLRSTGVETRVGCFERLGVELILELRFHRIRLEAQPPMVFLVGHDVTEAERPDPELLRPSTALYERERLRAVGQLASGVTHDIANALCAMRLRLEAVQADPACAGQRENLDALAQVVADTTERIGRLQDFARNRAARPAEAVPLRLLVREAVELVRPELERASQRRQRPVRVLHTIPELPDVRASPAELRHVFVNLLLNARDAMPGGGTITVSALQVGNQVRVVVQDDGPGIPAAHLGRIFEPFFTTKESRGTGLGLAMAASVMASFGGSIAAANRTSGGACFTLTFPVATSQVAEPPAAQPGPPLAGLRLLLVDDDPVTRSALERALGLHSVTAVATGAEAVARAGTGPRFDACFLDLGLPDLDGFEVAAALLRAQPGLPIFVLTGWAHEISSEDPRRKLVRELVAKPVGQRELQRLLHVAAGTAPVASSRGHSA